MADATQAELDALQKAHRQGLLEFQYEDRKMRFRSLKEMRSLIREMKRELGLLPKGPTRKYMAPKSGTQT